MTQDQIDAVLRRVRSRPPSRQEDTVHVLLAMEAKASSVYELSDDERSDLEAALEEVARGDVASNEKVAAVFARRR